MKRTIEEIRKFLNDSNISCKANDVIADHLNDDDRKTIKKEVEKAFQGVLDALLIKTSSDHNTKGTAERVSRMYIDEVFKGRYHPLPNITDFPNVKNLDEIYTLGPISLRSACSHHFVPIIGNVWLGILPNQKLLGISKFVRLIDHIASMPHIQEEFAIILADKIQELINPKGIAIIIDAQHYCMKWRGVKESNTTMRNSVMRGLFREESSFKEEFMALIR